MWFPDLSSVSLVYPGVSFQYGLPKTPHLGSVQEAPWLDAEPPPPALCEVEEWQLYSEHLLNIQAPHPIIKAVSRHQQAPEEAHLLCWHP